ncbi:polycystic kidney disease 1 like 1 [Notolabrus celidotus]|uniref:polycystic kidney disease 1 like 1 n=1 Tax=Notolabrus celidotus TaxID=1203425 RepID=UPI00148F91B3|nr:polycystic kidney disease 1 like 1 [Notolabrus celidotus]
MTILLVCTLVSFLHLVSATVPPSDHEDSPWLLGCVTGSARLHGPGGARDPDPVTCCVRCLDEGFQAEGFTSGGCHCGNCGDDLLAGESLNTSHSRDTEGVRGENKRQSVLSLPVGDGGGSVALNRTDRPFLCRICVSISPHRVQAGKSFTVKVSGRLAGRLNQPTGTLQEGGQELSFVSVEFEEPTPKGQSSQHVSVFDDGSFGCSSDWIFDTPGKYKLNITVSNPLSTLSSSLHLSVLQPSSHSLVILVLHGPLGVPSCSPSLQTELNKGSMEAVYLGDPVTLQAHLADGPAAEFSWRFTGRERNMEDRKKPSLSYSDCVNSSVSWTFETEGVHVVSVNASDAFGWTQETKCILVVRPAVSDLRVSVSESQLTPREAVSVDVSSQIKSTTVYVEGNSMSSPQGSVNQTWQPPTSQSPAHSPARNVQIYAAKQAYPTNTDITLSAVAEVPDPVELLWHFGDSTSIRSTSRSITKRYLKPGRYDVVVVMSSSSSTLTSDVFPLVVQRVVKLNRLLHQASVLQNQTLTVSCRVNEGSDVTFLWSFGDGSSRVGGSAEQHVYHRTGEFTVNVIVSNLVSSASLSSLIFVVDRPCQPPPVKNMGPLKVQVHRYEVIRLGVTYDAEVDCDISSGLHYAWTLFDSAGRVFALPLIPTHRQSLVLPGHLLHYDTYTAVAKVQVVGSVVYSNYSVSVQVIPSPPVAVIQDGTNIFINNRNSPVVTLDGRRSSDPDFPRNPLSFSWMCKPVSSIPSSCFHKDVPSSSPVLTFPASYLKHNFDQFQFTLTVHSGERTASSETFVTLTPNVNGKVSVHCSRCHGEQLNWDESFSVSSTCEGCASENVQYSWSLYLVNASSKPVTDVPFCYTVDLGAPSNIFEGSAAPPQTPGASTLHPPATDASHDINAVSASEMRARKPNLIQTDSLSKRLKSGEEPFYHPQGEFDPLELLYSSSEYQSLPPDNSSVQYSALSDHSDLISEFESDSSADWDLSPPVLESGSSGDQQDYDAVWMIPEEGGPGMSAGRPTGVDGETVSPGDYSAFDPAFYKDKGSNLVDDRHVVTAQDLILLDLPRDLVDRRDFESYTYAGISSPSLSFRPFSLKPGSRYMLEVTARSHERFLGRAQLFLKTNPAPKDVTCQIQPITGTELYTHFSIFCTSGKKDLVYEYSFSVGDRPPRMLYQGRDFQYYFSLPSGDPDDDYKVTLYTVIRSSTHETATKPCPVTVRVQPSFLRDNSSSSHLHPDQELSESGLRNLSGLLQLGNRDEIRNYVSLLSDILNRLSGDTEANTHAQRHTRNVLICTLCELESSEQTSMLDNICILKSLLRVTRQVTLAGARRVTSHVQVISTRLLQSRAPGWYHLDQKTLDTLVALLSHSLQAAAQSEDFTSEKSNSGDIKLPLESDTRHHDVKNPPSNRCMQDSSRGVHRDNPGSTSVKQLVAHILQTAADLMLTYILFHEASEHRVSTGFILLHASYLNQNSTVIISGSSTFYLPSSVIQLLFDRRRRETERPCVLSVLTELTHSPYIRAHQPGKLSGPVVDLSVYSCSTKRKIPVRSFSQPINIQLQPPHTNKSYATEHILLRNQINYHSFNITQQHLQQAVQLSVAFKPSLHEAFPIMLLFRMSERPTPSMHHLRKIHQWGSHTARVTLPPSFLSAAGVGHLALLNADFVKAARHKHLSEQVSYSLTVDTHLCLSWDDHQGAWTQHGCRTQQTDMSTVVNCSCQQLRPLTVMQQQIQSSRDTSSLDPFLSVPADLRLLCVLMLCVFLYIPGFVVCRRADAASEANYRVHYLPDNSPHDPYLYALTVHTGLCSAARMSAKVYIVLKGEEGSSQTKELQVPGYTLFRQNSQDTFILSAADNLGALCGIHIWHDNTGPSPSWYLKHVEVSEVNRGSVEGRAWLFVSLCWLAVNEGDGRVERMLRVCSEGIGFAEMLSLKLSEYLTDHHMWISVLSCPCPSSFTRTQRLSISLLLLMGYACVNTVIISQMDEQLLFEVGFINASAVSITTGILSVVAALPAAAFISFLFRLREVKLSGSEVQHTKYREAEKDFVEDTLSVTDSVSESHLFWSSLHQWAQETWRNKHQGTDERSVSSTCVENKASDKEPEGQTEAALRKEHALIAEIKLGPEFQNVSLIAEGSFGVHSPQGNKSHRRASSRFQGSQKALLLGAMDGGQTHQGKQEEGRQCEAAWFNHSRHDDVDAGPKKRRVRPASQWSPCAAWTLCVLLTLFCLVLSAELGLRFSSGKFLLWIHSLFFSLILCIFFIQPAVVVTAAVTVSLWFRDRADFHHSLRIRTFETGVTNRWIQDDANQHQIWKAAFPQPERCSKLDKLLGARRRARYLLHVRPPTQAELRKTCRTKRKQTLLCKTFRDLCVGVSMLFLMLCITYNSSPCDHNHLKAVRKHFLRSQGDAFMSIRKHDDWWKWAQTSLLPLMYKNASTTTKNSIKRGKRRTDEVKASMFQSIMFNSSALFSQLKGDTSTSIAPLSGTCRTRKTELTRGNLTKIFYDKCETRSLHVRRTTYVMIAEPILWKMKDCSSFQGDLSVTLMPEYPGSVLSGRKTSAHSHNSVLTPTSTPPRTCGQLGRGVEQSATIGLGHRKSDAASKLKLLHSADWLCRQTTALTVQFTVFIPAANVFTTVTLIAQRSPAGVLLPSARVRSVRVHHTPAVWDYAVMACQLLFLVLSLLQLWDQVYCVGQQGLMGYWRTPCNWLEVTLLIVTLMYFTYYIHHSVIVQDVVELLERHNHGGHVDVTLLADWEQFIRSLRGVLLFLHTMKCVSVLRMMRAFAASAALLTRTLSRLFWPTISGLVLIVALSCVGNLPLTETSWAFRLLSCSPQTLLCHYWGRRASKRVLLTGCDLLYRGLLHLSSIVWTAAAVGVVSSLVRSAKASRPRRNVFTVTELTNHIRQRVSEFTGRARKSVWLETEEEGRAYHLEEFESLVDELLFKLNVLSNSLHHTLPLKAHRYREDSPDASLIQEPLITDTRDFVRPLITDETKAHTDVGGHVETLTPSHLLRSKLELEALSLLDQRSKRADCSSDTVVPATKAEENCRSPHESAPHIRVYTEEKLKQIEQRTARDDSCLLRNAQATHTEVVVEVLVHEEPGSLPTD